MGGKPAADLLPENRIMAKLGGNLGSFAPFSLNPLDFERRPAYLCLQSAPERGP